MGLAPFFEVSEFEDAAARAFETLENLDLDLDTRASARSAGLDVEAEPEALA